MALHIPSFLLGQKYTADNAKIFGVYWDKSSNPTLTRTHDAVGMIANAGVDGYLVQNDFDNAPIYREIGEVTDDLGNVFVRIPKFYIKKTDGTGFKTWQISKTKYPGFYLPWCFWDFSNNKELPYVDVGKYKASLSGDGKLESKPDTEPLVNTTIVQFRNYAKANGTGYQLLDIHVVDVLQTLFYVEFATLNSQSIAQGWTAGRYSGADLAVISETSTNRVVLPNATADLYSVGQPIAIGTSQNNASVCNARHIISIEPYDVDNKAIVFDGAPVDITAGNFVKNSGWRNGFSRNIAASTGSINSNSDGKNPFIYRGIESLWGDLFQFVDGVNINDYQAWVAINAENYASNVFAAPYEQIGYVNVQSEGYISQVGYDIQHPYAAFPTDIGGSSSTYYTDYYISSSGQRIVLFGGGWNSALSAGISYWSMASTTSSSPVSYGGRLVKKPL